MTSTTLDNLCYLSANAFNVEIQKRILEMDATPTMTLVSMDLDNFNYINDLFGYEVGDLILKRLTKHFSSHLNAGELFTNTHADHFLFCINSNSPQAVLTRFLEICNWGELLVDILPKDYTIVVSGGIVEVRDAKNPLTSLLDKANYVRKKSKGNVTSTFNIYDDKIDEENKWQKTIIFMMESALNNREIEMYLQPKSLIKTGEVVGAEALARWNSPQYGMIYPDRFIPIMERTGFIRQLDFFMLREACVFLKKSSEIGIPLLPISVNFSKATLTTENLVENIFQTVNHIGIPTSLIEIEFTESISLDALDKLINIVADLKTLGFNVSLDDFGSAYSSLSCLKDLPIDIIKIDKGFIKTSINNDKGKVIVSKIVELIKSMRMLSVMEGVETQDQLDFLSAFGCDVGQGYFYAKPMPVDSYIEYIDNNSTLTDLRDYISKQTNSKDRSHLYVIPQEFQMDNWELYALSKNIDIGLMKGYLDGDATVQYINDRALEYLGYTRHEFREIFNNSIVAFTHPDDAHIVKKNAQTLINTGKALAFQTRAIRKDGKVIVLQGRSSCVIDNYGRPIGIYAFQDVTEDLSQLTSLQDSLLLKIKELEQTVKSQRITKEALRLSEERYKIILDQSDDIMFDWNFENDSILFSSKYKQLFGNLPVTQNITTNATIRERIHPNDLDVFEDWVKNTYKKAGRSEARFRIKSLDGNYISVRCRSSSICSNNIPTNAVGVFTSICLQK